MVGLVSYKGNMLAVLLAAAAPEAAVMVNPADPTAPFKGDGGALKFDPTCRDYTLDTVQSNPSCAARSESRGRTFIGHRRNDPENLACQEC